MTRHTVPAFAGPATEAGDACQPDWASQPVLASGAYAPRPPRGSRPPSDREEPIVGQKTVRFSDLSGQLITEEDTLTRVVVLEHPELGDSPVEFEALLDEAKTIEKAAVSVAVIELHLPGE